MPTSREKNRFTKRLILLHMNRLLVYSSSDDVIDYHANSTDFDDVTVECAKLPERARYYEIGWESACVWEGVWEWAGYLGIFIIPRLLSYWCTGTTTIGWRLYMRAKIPHTVLGIFCFGLYRYMSSVCGNKMLMILWRETSIRITDFFSLVA